MPLTEKKGAYLLFIELAVPLQLALPMRPPTTLPPGRYAYAGSAYGPGGLRARIARHLRKDKTQRWHIDRLTAAGDVIAVQVEVGGSECALFEDLRARAGASVPVPRFGSSDCRRCPAHLLLLPDDVDTDSIRRGVG